MNSKNVCISEDLYDRISEKCARNGFGSVDEFVEHILQIIADDSSTAMDEEEKRLLEKRMRELGYM